MAIRYTITPFGTPIVPLLSKIMTGSSGWQENSGRDSWSVYDQFRMSSMYRTRQVEEKCRLFASNRIISYKIVFSIRIPMHSSRLPKKKGIHITMGLSRDDMMAIPAGDLPKYNATLSPTRIPFQVKVQLHDPLFQRGPCSSESCYARPYGFRRQFSRISGSLRKRKAAIS